MTLDRFNEIVAMGDILVFLLCLTVFPALAAFKRTRNFSGYAYIFASYVFGASLWVSSAILVYSVAGLSWLLAGMFLLWIGVFPIAVVILASNGLWAILVTYIIGAVVTYGARLVGVWLCSKD
jgi:hypothetical protein